MDAFDEKHWNKLQVLVWVLMRHKEPVRWAAHQPGATLLLDLNANSENLDKEPPDDIVLLKKTGEPVYLPEPDEPRYFESEEELLITAMAEFDCVCPLDEARKDVIVAIDSGRLVEHSDRDTGSTFFVHAEVLQLWRPLTQPLSHEQPPKRLPSLPDVLAFLLDYADGTRSEAECREAAEEHFGVPMPASEKLWRPVWREVPKEKKLARGRRTRNKAR
jgi:hypothetical protein